MFWKRNESEVTKEFEEYYLAERKERAGLAWLMAFVTLCIGAVLLIGAFLGGRWLYGRLNHDDQKKGVAVISISQTEVKKSGDSEKDRAQEAEKQAALDALDATLSGKNKATNGSVAGASTNSTQALPNTGPGDLWSVFIGVAIISALVYRMTLASKPE